MPEAIEWLVVFESIAKKNVHNLLQDTVSSFDPFVECEMRAVERKPVAGGRGRGIKDPLNERVGGDSGHLLDVRDFKCALVKVGLEVGGDVLR